MQMCVRTVNMVAKLFTFFNRGVKHSNKENKIVFYGVRVQLMFLLSVERNKVINRL